MPALTAAQARDFSAGLTPDDIEQIIDREIVRTAETGVANSVYISDRTLGKGKTIWSYVVNEGTGSPLLDEVCRRYRAAGYDVRLSKAPEFKRDGLDARKHSLSISWALPEEQRMAA